jgi:Uma2 family endonuclease
LLVEVTSKTTERKDRGVKLEDYLEIETLEEYLIVSHTRRELELWTRGSAGWTRTLVTGGSVTLRSGATIDVDRLYADLPD